MHKRCIISDMAQRIEKMEVNQQVDHESAVARIEREMEQKEGWKYCAQVASPLADWRLCVDASQQCINSIANKS